MDYITDKGPVSLTPTMPEKAMNGLGRTGRDQDCLYMAETSSAFNGECMNLGWSQAHNALITTGLDAGKSLFASYTSPVVSCRFPATQFLPSWNVKYSEGAGFRVYLRVFDSEKQASKWFFIGEGGDWREQDDEITSDDQWGTVRVDYLELSREAHAFQYRVDFITPEAEVTNAPNLSGELHRFAMHYSGIGSSSYERAGEPVCASIKVHVPYRSQLDVEREDMRHVVCCPTCVAMVLESLGINQRTMELCETAYCERYQLYGLWPRAAQAAFMYGAKSWVDRFRTMASVAECLKSGRPIIASIRVKKGELRGSRYPESAGHLIVIKGITDSGKVLVNDPYSAGPEGHEIEYEMEDIEKCWLDCGGVAIMIEPQ